MFSNFSYSIFIDFCAESLEISYVGAIFGVCVLMNSLSSCTFFFKLVDWITACYSYFLICFPHSFLSRKSRNILCGRYIRSMCRESLESCKLLSYDSHSSYFLPEDKKIAVNIEQFLVRIHIPQNLR